MNPPRIDIGVLYIARGEDENALEKFAAFRDSYERFPSNISHSLHIIFKGFRSLYDIELVKDIFRNIAHESIYTSDDSFDIGAYFIAAAHTDHQFLCFLNTASEIRGALWLDKLFITLIQPGVGMVGCTASYEAPQHPGQENVPFPNAHLRSNAFMIRRDQFLAMRPARPITSKIDAYALEHGPFSFTRRIAAQGQEVLVVGKDGRGYGPSLWPVSETFRQGSQSNLLIGDNQTRAFELAPLSEKRRLIRIAWGDAAVERHSRLAEISDVRASLS